MTQEVGEQNSKFTNGIDSSDILAGPTRVAEVMTGATTSVSVDQSLSDVVTMMATRSFHHVLVIDGEKRVQGVISDRDVLRALARTQDWSKKPVTEVMTAHPATTTPDTMISSAARLMLTKRINCLPVIGPDDQLCGIVTSTDLLQGFEKIQALIEQQKTRE